MRVSLFPIAATVFTIRHYYPVLPTEMALTLGGIILIGIAWNLLRYLRSPKFGFTAEADQQDLSGRRQAEALLIAGMTTQPHASGTTEFHGGTGSGGGAGGQF